MLCNLSSYVKVLNYAPCEFVENHVASTTRAMGDPGSLNGGGVNYFVCRWVHRLGKGQRYGPGRLGEVAFLSQT